MTDFTRLKDVDVEQVTLTKTIRDICFLKTRLVLVSKSSFHLIDLSTSVILCLTRDRQLMDLVGLMQSRRAAHQIRLYPGPAIL